MKGFMGRQSGERVCRDATSGLVALHLLGIQSRLIRAGTHAAAGVALSPDLYAVRSFVSTMGMPPRPPRPRIKNDSLSDLCHLVFFAHFHPVN